MNRREFMKVLGILPFAPMVAAKLLGGNEAGEVEWVHLYDKFTYTPPSQNSLAYWAKRRNMATKEAADFFEGEMRKSLRSTERRIFHDYLSEYLKC